MKQQSLEASGFEKYRKKTRKEMFLDEMNEIIPWAEMTKAIAPYYPKEPQGAGRKPIGLERMLRIHFLQHCSSTNQWLGWKLLDGEFFGWKRVN